MRHKVSHLLCCAAGLLGLPGACGAVPSGHQTGARKTGYSFELSHICKYVYAVVCHNPSQLLVCVCVLSTA
jgi:hypothetical protein